MSRRPPDTKPKAAKSPSPAGNIARGRCVCSAVEIEIVTPAFWAWHDHSRETQRAHGAAYATYIGCWKSKVGIVKGKARIKSFVDADARRIRSFCSACGTPLMYERGHSPKMVNIPRALFETRTGREPRYHVGYADVPEWAYQGEKLKPLKNYPGVLQSRPRAKSE